MSKTTVGYQPTTTEAASIALWRTAGDAPTLARYDAATATCAALEGADSARIGSYGAHVQRVTNVSRSEVYKWCALAHTIERGALETYTSTPYPPMPQGTVLGIGAYASKPGRMCAADVLVAMQMHARKTDNRWTETRARDALSAYSDVEGLRKRAALALTSLTAIAKVDGQEQEQYSDAADALSAGLDVLRGDTYGASDVLTVYVLTSTEEQRAAAAAEAEAREPGQPGNKGETAEEGREASEDTNLRSLSEELDATKTALAAHKTALAVLLTVAKGAGLTDAVDVDAFVALVVAGTFKPRQTASRSKVQPASGADVKVETVPGQ